MTRCMRPAALLLLVFALILPVFADQAKSLYVKGQDAEARQNYEQAYDLYKQAYDLKPKDLNYRTAYERLRFLAGASHIHRGQLLREAGKLDEALAEFQKAGAIDSSSFMAKQEAQQTQRMIDAGKGQPRSSAPPGGQRKRIEQMQGPVELAPIANTPITLVMRPEDAKTIYETVGKLAGINVLFDPDYTSRRINVDLSGVTLEDALQIIAMQSKTFWRPVTPNTIFVAQDVQSKRKELEQSVIKTFYMSNLSQQTELQDVGNALRQILEISKVQQLTSQNAIVVRGTPDQIALAEKLINDLDKARPEVVVDFAILQVSRDKAHTLGINPPTSATIALQNNINVTSTTNGTSTTSGNTNGTSGTPNQVNLNRLGNLNATDFTATIPSATATALFTDSNTKLVQNPQVRSVDGQKASFKIGEKIPIATGSFQPGIGGVGINPLVNTQFTYQEVGVIINVTPRIHAGGEVTLKLEMTDSSVIGQASLGGITQPTFGNKSIEDEITLQDGEVSLLGGMYEDQSTHSLTGIPGLAQIPFLKYFFSQTQTDHSQNEIVFVVIPHIVRKQELSDSNERAFAVGTANAIQLRRIAPRGETPIAQAAAPASQPSAPVAQPQPTTPAPVDAAPATPAPVTPTPPPASSSASFSFDPANITQPAGATFAVNVLLSGAQNVYSVPLQVSYDPKLVQVVDVAYGSFLSQDGTGVVLANRDDGNGTLQVNATRSPGASGVSGMGSVITLTLKAKASGQGTLTISKGGARDPAMQSIPVSGAVASMTVQ